MVSFAFLIVLSLYIAMKIMACTKLGKETSTSHSTPANIEIFLAMIRLKTR